MSEKPPSPISFQCIFRPGGMGIGSLSVGDGGAAECAAFAGVPGGFGPSGKMATRFRKPTGEAPSAASM